MSQKALMLAVCLPLQCVGLTRSHARRCLPFPLGTRTCTMRVPAHFCKSSRERSLAGSALPFSIDRQSICGVDCEGSMFFFCAAFTAIHAPGSAQRKGLPVKAPVIARPEGVLRAFTESALCVRLLGNRLNDHYSLHSTGLPKSIVRTPSVERICKSSVGRAALFWVPCGSSELFS